jgi:hypothetical protein
MRLPWFLDFKYENRRSEESRYDYSLHGMLIEAQGMTCPAVG